MAPQYCPQLGGSCWPSDVVCSTTRDCGGRLYGCRNPILTLNCANNLCECPAAYPVFCAANGAMPESCWTAGTDCATRTVCGDQVYACNAGRRLNCSTLLCDATTPTIPPTPPMATPWIVRTFYLRPAYTENNVRFGSNVRSVEFRADGTYLHTLASNPATNGRYVVSGTRLTFPTGALSSTTLDLNTSFSSSCRVLTGLGSPPLWSPAEVPACPSFNRVTQNECQYVGTYTRTSRSGSISGSGSGSETETTDTVRLYRDHFYTVDFSSSRRTCFSSRCTTLYNTSQTRVGTWSVATGADTFSLTALRGAAWRFTRSTTACPGP